jgi:hypothetical protein
MAKAQALIDPSMLRERNPTNMVKAPPPAPEPEPPVEKVPGYPLNFRVPADFRRDFRVYAAERGMRHNEVLYAAFKCLQERGDGK